MFSTRTVTRTLATSPIDKIRRAVVTFDFGIENEVDAAAFTNEAAALFDDVPAAATMDAVDVEDETVGLLSIRVDGNGAQGSGGDPYGEERTQKSSSRGRRIVIERITLVDAQNDSSYVVKFALHLAASRQDGEVCEVYLPPQSNLERLNEILFENDLRDTRALSLAGRPEAYFRRCIRGSAENEYVRHLLERVSDGKPATKPRLYLRVSADSYLIRFIFTERNDYTCYVTDGSRRAEGYGEFSYVIPEDVVDELVADLHAIAGIIPVHDPQDVFGVFTLATAEEASGVYEAASISTQLPQESSSSKQSTEAANGSAFRIVPAANGPDDGQNATGGSRNAMASTMTKRRTDGGANTPTHSVHFDQDVTFGAQVRVKLKIRFRLLS